MMKINALPLALASCSILPGSSATPLAPLSTAAAAAQVLAAPQTTVSTLWSFAWLSLGLIVFLPGVRPVLLQLWNAIFGTLALPFLALQRKWGERSE